MKLLAFTQAERDKLDSMAAVTGFEFEDIGTFETGTTQNPTGLGETNKIRVSFGAGGNTSGNEFTMAADGTLTCNTGGDQYQLEFMFRVGRTGAAGVSIIVGRLMYAADGVEANAVQAGPSTVIEVDNQNIIFPEFIIRHIKPATGSKLWVEIARDEAGNNSGGLLTVQPSATLAGWNDSNSASLTIEKETLV